MFDIIYQAFDQLLSYLTQEQKDSFNYDSIRNYLTSINAEMEALKDQNQQLQEQLNQSAQNEQISDSFMMNTELSITELDESVLNNESFTMDQLEKETRISLYDQKLEISNSSELLLGQDKDIPTIDINPLVSNLESLISETKAKERKIDDLAQKNDALIDTFKSLFGEFDDDILDDAEVENAQLREKIKSITQEFEEFKQNSALSTPQKLNNHENIETENVNQLKIELTFLKGKCQKYIKDYKRIKAENQKARKFLIALGKINNPETTLIGLINSALLKLLHKTKARFEAIFDNLLALFSQKIAAIDEQMIRMSLKYQKMVVSDELFYYDNNCFKDSTLLINAVNCFRAVFPETFRLTPYSSTDAVASKLDDLKSSIENVFHDNNIPVPRSQSLVTRISALNRSLKSTFMKENLIAN